MMKYKLGDILTVKHGFPFKGEYFSSTGQKIILTPANFYESGGFKYTPGKEKYYLGDFPKEYICSKNDLIVAMTQQSEGLLGSTALVPENDRFLHNQRIGLIHTDRNMLLPEYADYLFRTQSVRNQIRGSASGTKVKHTSPDKIYDVSVTIPNINSQKSIVQLLRNLDDKIALNHRMNAKLEAMAKRLYDYWFVQFDFPDEHGKPYKSSGGKMVWNEQLKREIPAGWEVKKLGEVVDVRRGASPRPIDDYISDNGTHWLKISDVTSIEGPFIFKIKEFIKQEGVNKSVFLSAGNLVLSNSATPGIPKIICVDTCIHDGWLYFLNQKLSNEYLYLFFLNMRSQLAKQGNGSIFINLKTDIVKDFLCVLPNQELLDKFQNIINPIFKLNKDNSKTLFHLTSLRDRLLPLLMNGQVEVLEG